MIKLGTRLTGVRPANDRAVTVPEAAASSVDAQAADPGARVLFARLPQNPSGAPVNAARKPLRGNLAPR